jgi:beta-galactosidase GanA
MQWSNYNGHQTALRSHIEKLGKIRAQNSALRRGTRKQLYLTNDVYVYEMVDGNNRIVVALNRGDSAASVQISGNYTDLLTNKSVNGASLSIPARSSMVLK